MKLDSTIYDVGKAKIYNFAICAASATGKKGSFDSILNLKLLFGQ
jgi:hypothetical protein